MILAFIHLLKKLIPRCVVYEIFLYVQPKEIFNSITRVGPIKYILTNNFIIPNKNIEFCKAIAAGNVDLTLFWLNQGASLKYNMDKPVRMTSLNGGNLELLKLLHFHGANVHTLNNLIFQNALKDNNTKIIDYLFDYIHPQDILSIAITYKNAYTLIKIVKLLPEYKELVLIEFVKNRDSEGFINGFNVWGPVNLKKIQRVALNTYNYFVMKFFTAKFHMNVTKTYKMAIDQDFNDIKFLAKKGVAMKKTYFIEQHESNHKKIPKLIAIFKKYNLPLKFSPITECILKNEPLHQDSFEYNHLAIAARYGSIKTYEHIFNNSNPKVECLPLNAIIDTESFEKFEIIHRKFFADDNVENLFEFLLKHKHLPYFSDLGACNTTTIISENIARETFKAHAGRVRGFVFRDDLLGTISPPSMLDRTCYPKPSDEEN